MTYIVFNMSREPCDINISYLNEIVLGSFDSIESLCRYICDQHSYAIPDEFTEESLLKQLKKFDKKLDNNNDFRDYFELIFSDNELFDTYYIIKTVVNDNGWHLTKND